MYFQRLTNLLSFERNSWRIEKKNRWSSYPTYCIKLDYQIDLSVVAKLFWPCPAFFQQPCGLYHRPIYWLLPIHSHVTLAINRSIPEIPGRRSAMLVHHQSGRKVSRVKKDNWSFWQLKVGPWNYIERVSLTFRSKLTTRGIWKIPRFLVMFGRLDLCFVFCTSAHET